MRYFLFLFPLLLLGCGTPTASEILQEMREEYIEAIEDRWIDASEVRSYQETRKLHMTQGPALGFGGRYEIDVSNELSVDLSGESLNVLSDGDITMKGKHPVVQGIGGDEFFFHAAGVTRFIEDLLYVKFEAFDVGLSEDSFSFPDKWYGGTFEALLEDEEELLDQADFTRALLFTDDRKWQQWKNKQVRRWAREIILWRVQDEVVEKTEDTYRFSVQTSDVVIEDTLLFSFDMLHDLFREVWDFPEDDLLEGMTFAQHRKALEDLFSGSPGFILRGTLELSQEDYGFRGFEGQVFDVKGDPETKVSLTKEGENFTMLVSSVRNPFENVRFEKRGDHIHLWVLGAPVLVGTIGEDVIDLTVPYPQNGMPGLELEMHKEKRSNGETALSGSLVFTPLQGFDPLPPEFSDLFNNGSISLHLNRLVFDDRKVWEEGGSLFEIDMVWRLGVRDFFTLVYEQAGRPEEVTLEAPESFASFEEMREDFETFEGEGSK